MTKKLGTLLCNFGARSYLTVAALLTTAFFAPEASAKIFALTDFDGPLVEYRQVYKGTFNTAVRLFRVRDRGLPLGPVVQGPEFIDVLTDDFEKAQQQGLLARGEGKLGAQNQTIRSVDGQTVIVGNYQFVYPNSYARFNGVGEYSNALQEDLENAIRVSQTKGGRWKGRFFDLYAFYLAQPQAEVACGVGTMRGGETLGGFFTLLKKKKIIERAPDPEWTTLLGNPEADRYGRSSTAAMKKKWAEEQLQRIGRIPFDATQEEILNANGDGKIRAHTVVFFEDKPENFQALFEAAQDYSQRKAWKFPVKIVLFHAGTPEELAKWGGSPALVVTSSGRVRAAKDEDFLGSLKVNLSKADRKLLKLPSSWSGADISGECRDVLNPKKVLNPKGDGHDQ